jgi:hypothetical protein
MRPLWAAALLVFLLLVTPLAATHPSRLQLSSSSDEPKDSLPAEATAMLPPGAISLAHGHLPVGAGGAPILFHVWASTRNSEDVIVRHSRWSPSPFCVDLFTMGPQPSGWRYVTSAVYLAADAPTQVDARWLQPGKEEGPVFIITAPAYTQTRYTVITFPKGIREGYGTADYVVQEFDQGGVGGGKILQNFGVDSRGYMTVISESWYDGKKNSSTVYVWDGRGFVSSSSRRGVSTQKIIKK